MNTFEMAINAKLDRYNAWGLPKLVFKLAGYTVKSVQSVIDSITLDEGIEVVIFNEFFGFEVKFLWIHGNFWLIDRLNFPKGALVGRIARVVSFLSGLEVMYGITRQHSSDNFSD